MEDDKIADKKDFNFDERFDERREFELDREYQKKVIERERKFLEELKTKNEVFDKRTLMVLFSLLAGKHIDEFIGICRGILADDELNSHEKDYIIEWIENHDLHYHDFVGTLYVLLKNNEDLKQSKTLLLDFLGGKPPVKEVKSMSTKLLFDSLVKPIVFRDTKFCLTGKFVSAYGNRKVLEELV